MTGPFVSDKLTDYRPSYRAMAFSPFPNKIDFYFPDGSIIDANEFATLPEPCLDWAVLSFQKFANTLNRPWLLVHGDYFSERQWNLPTEQMDLLRGEGLNIFMYEPIFIYNEDGSWPWHSSAGVPCFQELNRINDFIATNKILAPVTIHLGEYGLGVWLHEQGLFKNLIFRDFNSYFQEAVDSALKYKWPTLPADKITHKFLSLNFRYESLREILVAHFEATGRTNEGFISFYHFHDRLEFLKRLPFDPTGMKNWAQIESGIEKIQHRLPMTLDATNPKKSDPIFDSIPDINQDSNVRDMWKLKTNYFPKAFVFIFSESRPFSPRSEISEKTIHPLLCKKPFLVFAAPYFLQQMREFGFKTFSDFWDESFDEIEDPKARLESFLTTVDAVLAKDLHELQELHLKMQPILDYNYDWIVNHSVIHQQKKLLNSGPI